jgi:hypothetical protein
MRWATGSVLVALGSTALLLVAHAARAPAAAAERHVKPLAPLQIEMTPLPREKKDAEGQRRLRVSVTPRVDAPRLEVTVTLPPGVSVVRGEMRWQAPARARVAQKRELLLSVPASGEQRVVATARIVFPKSPPMSRAAGYTFNPKAEPGRPESGSAPTSTLKEPSTVPTIPVKPAPRGR